MLLRRLIPILVFALALPICGFGQENVVQSADKDLPTKVLQDNQQNKKEDIIKSVPIADKTIKAIRQQNSKATMGQMHTINKAMRKSMTVRKHK